MAINISAADSNNDIARNGVFVKICRDILECAEILCVVRFAIDAFYHVACMYNTGVDLPSRIDIRYQHFVCVTEAGHMLAEQRSCARIAVALKHAEDSAG